jgi:putative hydrolase of HD superfamily
MSKEKRIIDYYVICNKLKKTIRKGWLDWNVKQDRIESVAEHIYGTQMLALATYSEYDDYKDLDIYKVIMMLAIHELGETIIGDLTVYDIEKKEKEIIEHKAVHDILNGLVSGEELEKLFLEFDEHKTKESLFAYQCDKLECDIQCKLYGEDNSVDLNEVKNINPLENNRVKKLIEQGKDWATMWIENDQEVFPYDKNFLKISNYILKNNIKK